jgi:hypothetical protein
VTDVSPQFSPPLRAQVLAVLVLLLVVVAAVVADPSHRGPVRTGADRPDQARLVAATTSATAASASADSFRQLTTDAAFRSGVQEGTRVTGGSLTMVTPRGRLKYAGKRWSWTRWTSPWLSAGQTFSRMVPSWNVTTPASTMVLVEARVHSTSGYLSGWKLVGAWSSRDAKIRRTSGARQADRIASMATDTLVAGSGVLLNRYQLRILPLRRVASTASPAVRSLQVVASRPSTVLPATSRPLLPAHTLNVPRYSQMTHRGQYPQWGGGGQAWCSPTSLSMILGYYHALPAASSYAWVSKKYADPWVDHVARAVYDYGYQGAGNWAFNTAYAAVRTGDAFVTRLTSLQEAERFIAAGIPLAASIGFSRGQLTGAPISASAGHLVVITGFTSTGDVIVNDPAAPTDSSVRRTYDRGQFERAWLRNSDGTVYVVRDAAHPLPARGADQNW